MRVASFQVRLLHNSGNFAEFRGGPGCSMPTGDWCGFDRAILCSNLAEQRHKIIRNRVALVGEESVSGVTGGTAAGFIGEPTMRIYIIGNDGITLCREAPAVVNDGEIAVASNAELHAAPLTGKRLLALWNALPGVEKRKKV